MDTRQLRRPTRRVTALTMAGGTALCLAILPGMPAIAAPAGTPAPATPATQHKPRPHQPPASRAAKAIKHVMVIDFENESYSSTFGPDSPATYLNQTLVPQGELLENYFAIGHVSMDNYVAQVSGQAPNEVTSNDCSSVTAEGFVSVFSDLNPGTLDPDQKRYPGQYDGQGCVFPKAVRNIGNQLAAAHPRMKPERVWREYAEDMGNDPSRDLGVVDPLGGTDCAHPAQLNGVGTDQTGTATATDQYADRHNPFIYFHSVIDFPPACAAHVVPLGTVTVGTGGAPDTFHGHLAQDLSREATTPLFSFITPNLCNDGHDATCAGTNTEGGKTGGLVGADLWLKHWMPLILNSPAYRNGSTLVVITFDEGNITDFRAGDSEQPGPNSGNPGYSSLLNIPIPGFGGKTYYQVLGYEGLTPLVAPPAGTMPGGGQIGALLLNPRWIHAGTIDTTGSYNHYSALRTYEDLLGIHQGGADRRGHLGFAATATAFGPDVFRAWPKR